MKFIARLLITIGSVYLAVFLLPQAISVSGVYAALIVALALTIMNVTIRPVLRILTLPLSLLTLGLFGFLIDGFILYFIGSFVEGFSVSGFWYAVLAALIISFSRSIVFSILRLS